MTIRILDDAVYHENIQIKSRDRHEGITLEAPRHATLELPAENRFRMIILNVPRVTVRGLHIHIKGNHLPIPACIFVVGK